MPPDVWAAFLLRPAEWWEHDTCRKQRFHQLLRTAIDAIASKLFTAAIRPLELGRTLSAGWGGSVGLEPVISRCFLRRSLAVPAASDMKYRFSSADARRDARHDDRPAAREDAACASRRQSPHLEHGEA